eukprot:6273609-Alexandrium_andersonii.AAC.1
MPASPGRPPRACRPPPRTRWRSRRSRPPCRGSSSSPCTPWSALFCLCCVHQCFRRLQRLRAR